MDVTSQPPLVVAVSRRSRRRFERLLDAAGQATSAVWPRDAKGRIDIGDTRTVEQRQEGSSRALIVRITSDPRSAYHQVWDNVAPLARLFDGDDQWPASAYPGAGQHAHVLPVAEIEDAAARFPAWLAGLELLGLPEPVVAETRAAVTAARDALPSTADAVPAYLPDLPAAQLPEAWIQQLAATLHELRMFAATNVSSQLAAGHGKSWEPQAILRLRGDGQAQLSVASYQFRQLADDVDGFTSALATVAERAATLHADARAELRGWLTHPADAQVLIEPDAAADMPEYVAAAPDAELVATWAAAVHATGAPAAVGFASGGSLRAFVARHEVSLDAEHAAQLPLHLRRLYALALADV